MNDIFIVLDDVCKPTRGTKYSAYIDFRSRVNEIIHPFETKIIPLGVKINSNKLKELYERVTFKMKDRYSFDEFLKRFYFDLKPRSSGRAKGIIAGSGVIDIDYPDEIGFIAHNFSGVEFVINKGDKIAQCTLKEHFSDFLGFHTDIVRDGGIGSTGR